MCQPPGLALLLLCSLRGWLCASRRDSGLSTEPALAAEGPSPSTGGLLLLECSCSDAALWNVSLIVLLARVSMTQLAATCAACILQRYILQRFLFNTQKKQGRNGAEFDTFW